MVVSLNDYKKVWGQRGFVFQRVQEYETSFGYSSSRYEERINILFPTSMIAVQFIQKLHEISKKNQQQVDIDIEKYLQNGSGIEKWNLPYKEPYSCPYSFCKNAVIFKPLSYVPFNSPIQIAIAPLEDVVWQTKLIIDAMAVHGWEYYNPARQFELLNKWSIRPLTDNELEQNRK